MTDIGNMTLHIGANEHQNMDVRIQEISCETLYIDDLDVTTVTGADRAISALDDAIAMVSDARSKIGAYENRLEYATSSLDTFEENMTDAMSKTDRCGYGRGNDQLYTVQCNFSRQACQF